MTCPRPPKTPHLNTPPHVYVIVWEDLHNTAQMYTQRKIFFLAVVLLLPPAMDGQYFKYMYLKYVFEIQNTILYFNTSEKNLMYFVFKYI